MTPTIGKSGRARDDERDDHAGQREIGGDRKIDAAGQDAPPSARASA